MLNIKKLFIMLILALLTQASFTYAQQTPSNASILELCWNADASRLLAGRNNALSIFDSDRQLIHELDWHHIAFHVDVIACHPTDPTLVVVGIAGNGVRHPISLLTVNVFTGEILSTIETGMFSVEIAIRPNTNQILVLGSEEIVIGYHEQRLEIWDFQTTNRLYSAIREGITEALWTHDGQTVLIFDAKLGELQFTDPTTWAISNALPIGNLGFVDIELSPHGDKFVTITQVSEEGYLESFIAIWDIPSGQKLVETSQDTVIVDWYIDWSPDQRYLAIAADDLFLLDTVTGTLSTYPLGGASAYSAAWNPVTGQLAYAYLANDAQRSGQIDFFPLPSR